MPGNWFGWKKDPFLFCSRSSRAFQGGNRLHKVMLGVLGLLLTGGDRPPSSLTSSSALDSHHLLTESPGSRLSHQRAHRGCQLKYSFLSVFVLSFSFWHSYLTCQSSEIFLRALLFSQHLTLWKPQKHRSCYPGVSLCFAVTFCNYAHY